MSSPTQEIGYTVDSAGTPGWGYFVGRDDEDNPDLAFPLSLSVYQRMRREETQLQSVLKAVKLPIERTQWRLDADGVRPDVAEFVSQNLGLPINGQPVPVGRRRQRDRFSWQEHLKLALTSLDYGFAAFEQVYRYDPETGRLYLRKLGWRPQSTISDIQVDRDGGLVGIQQDMLGAGANNLLTVDRLVMYVPEREGANWTGVSLLRPSYKYWLLKDRLLRVQALTVDRNGLGIPVYTGPEADLSAGSEEERRRRQEEDLKRGMGIARGFTSGQHAGAAIPYGAKLELLGVTGNLPDADKPIRYYDEQMARSALAHFLNLGNETGSWALGTTFADFFTLSLQTFALRLADIATQHIVYDLVDLNFGEDEPAPRIVFDEIGAQAAPTAEALQSLVQTKVIRPDDTLESFMRTRYGLPDADPTTARETSGGNPAAAAAEVSQKVYLAMREGVISREEARALIEAQGIEFDPDAADSTKETS